MQPPQSAEHSAALVRSQDVSHGAERWQRAADRYRTILGALPSAVALTNGQRLAYCNPAFCRAFNYTEEEALGLPARSYFADSQAYQQVISEATPTIVEGGTYRAELLMKRGDGCCFWASLHGQRLALDRSRTATLWLLDDITERRQAAQELRLSELRLEAAQAQALIGSWELGPGLDALYWSRQMFSLFDFDSNLGVPSVEQFLQHVDPEDVQLLLQAHRHVVESKEPRRLVYRSHSNLGSTRYFEVTIVPKLDERGQLAGITGTTQDVTERTRLQTQLQQASKMEAIGRLAGGVAHDFNNLLSVIGGNAELALQSLRPNDPLRQPLAEVLNASASAASLTRQLLAFSRRQLIEPKTVNLNAIIKHLHKMLHRLIGEDITLEMVLDEHLGAVQIDPGQFDQVLINLAVNARDAMPNGGRLTLSTANVDLDAEYGRSHSEQHPGRFVMLAVSDTGEGMSPQVKSCIFEPFFTTKPQGKGTGLGLSVIFGVIKQAGGSIETYSELGHGTTFKIYLPRVDEPVQPLGTGRPQLAAYEGTETILLVEDSEAVRELTAQMLRRLGYALIVAENGQNALAIVQDRKPAVDLLLTDLIMPEMGGRELGERIQALYPDVAIIYCSGYTEDTFVRLGLASDKLEFISKPFTMHQLGCKVRQTLDGRGAKDLSI